MKRITLEFVGGPWDGKALCTDSADREEVWLAAACYETSHHGAIGGRWPGPSGDAAVFARRHGWPATDQSHGRGGHRYLVSERRETEEALVVTFEYRPVETSRTPPLAAEGRET
jgi:hypothetical protein